ncbi:hypothetical protein CcaverHIS002_0400520 [Cutaneotrichosporon cavernicola]|uniref:Transcriptional adapter 2 n=1 Tax=Cutaneotrichosporon cavernicola TaxID=279322 RepID=A0AA48QVC6_9TREE|nr:uncharacterized protein CcaverHIS019_0400490 [Cutaneotrichosporon cavernicola]BEI83448.1 hypothetical protein CcaverHIS002_0400520 [Cutaneotrichosporon cavernicola]BEI91229.1 hypothetical protein CcaverHIS019_0400490 [Cutaneotrichosporon cavernicola]
MTVTQRRVRAADPAGPEDRAITEPGIKYTCDICGIDITHTVRMKCAHPDCAEIDICPNCFREGKKVQKHEPWHDYKVIEQHSYPIFCTDWGADEEMLLIGGCQAHGLGNWAEVADHVGTRTKEECELHYIEVFLGCGKGSDVKNDSEMPHETPEDEHYSRFMPPMNRTFSIDPDEFQRRKKARIEELRKPQPLAKGTAKTLTSAPTNHEVGGFMPGRLEFEYELENDAELAIKDLEFGLVLEYGGADQPMAKVTRPVEEEGGEDEGEDEEEEEEDVKPKIEEGEGSGSSSPGKRKRSEEEDPVETALEVEDPDELEVKIALLNIYRYKLDKRVMAKDLIFDRSLTQHKKLTALERKRPKEEKELIGRYKPLAKLQTAEDFEVFVEGIMHEHQLRRRITELQEYRRVGITMGYEAESYDVAKAARAGFRPVVSREQTDPIRTGARINAGQNRYLHGTPPLSDSRGVSTPPARPRAPTKPKDLRSAEGIELLTDEEALVASHTHVEPKKFQGVVAAMIIRNEALQGKLRRREARNKHHIDVNHAARIWDYLVMVGKVKLAYDAKIKAFDLKHGEKGFPPPPTVYVPAGGPPNPLPQSTIFANGDRPVMA